MGDNIILSFALSASNFSQALIHRSINKFMHTKINLLALARTYNNGNGHQFHLIMLQSQLYNLCYETTWYRLTMLALL